MQETGFQPSPSRGEKRAEMALRRGEGRLQKDLVVVY